MFHADFVGTVACGFFLHFLLYPLAYKEGYPGKSLFSLLGPFHHLSPQIFSSSIRKEILFADTL
jgi:hypothetical protein